MICEYCKYKNSWDCGDGWNRRNNCDSFSLAWEFLSFDQQEFIQRMLENMYGDRYG